MTADDFPGAPGFRGESDAFLGEFASEDFEEEVLEVVALIPEGRVLTYGDVAELLDRGGPRQVAKVMANEGGSVPWWRIVRADGSLPPRLAARAREHYLAESTPVLLNADGGVTRVNMRLARWLPVPEAQEPMFALPDEEGSADTDGGPE